MFGQKQIWWMAGWAILLAGCGSTQSRSATQQLLVSAAVDEAVASIDFDPLSGKLVYLDTKHVKEVKGLGFVNADYIISSLRQQMVAADVRLQESVETADFVVEARVGAIGTDGSEIVYGIPTSNSLSTAASLVPNAPSIPVIPEIALARKEAETGAAKLALFAYHRESKMPVWQSGVARAKSTAQDVWLLGAGPFQRGTIYSGTQFAGQSINLLSGEHGRARRGPMVSYYNEYIFEDPQRPVATESAAGAAAESGETVDGSPDEWLTPLAPRIVSPLERLTDWK